MIEIKKNKGKMSEALFFVVISLLFMCSFATHVNALGYAPLTIYGQITLEESPVSGGEVSIQTNKEGIVSASSISNENGEFIFVLTMEENSPITLQITTKVGEDIYVDIIEDALPWNSYYLDINLDLDTFAEVKIISSNNRAEEFDEDMEKIVSGEILDDPDLVKEFEDKYDMEVVSLDDMREENEEGSDAVLENPGSNTYLPAPESQKIKGLGRAFLEILAVGLVIACIFLIRHEAKQ